MTEPEIHDRWDRVADWIRHAADDVRIARGCLGLDPPALGGAAYHCQQAVEKVLKGFLVLGGIDFRKTHDLTTLGKIVVSHFPSLQPMLKIDSRWTAWGVAYRYPGDDVPEPDPTPEELAAALRLTERLEAALRSMAPEGAKPGRG